jgi:hypothetical protein
MNITMHLYFSIVVALIKRYIIKTSIKGISKNSILLIPFKLFFIGINDINVQGLQFLENRSRDNS